MIRYLVYDVEYDRDAYGHSLYQAAERFSSAEGPRLRDNDPRIQARWTFKWPVTISWVTLVEEDGRLLADSLQTLCCPEQTDGELLKRFFEAINALPANAQVVSWGGSCSDEPQLRLAAMRLGMSLPKRFVVPFQQGKRHGSGHVDLMNHLCGDAVRVHLAEYCAALRIPAKVTAAPIAVSDLVARGKWSLVKSICENDALSTAAVLIHADAVSSGSSMMFGSLQSLARLGARQKHRPYSEAFEAWAADLVRIERARLIYELASYDTAG